ncbi:hypothetical protein MSAN_00088000 [Mycena sanguinolenta]|uniref:Zn(2)-C6 fungal-type domain-containing protein n=1 Tax=Mycena sanguinolenta TaxID=230812 RepID=A0A8H6ZCW0_9AGAR|nr:hypothetical protein MSAN_00088000 [Mycena sanguinolenta]
MRWEKLEITRPLSRLSLVLSRRYIHDTATRRHSDTPTEHPRDRMEDILRAQDELFYATFPDARRPSRTDIEARHGWMYAPPAPLRSSVLALEAAEAESQSQPASPPSATISPTTSLTSSSSSLPSTSASPSISFSANGKNGKNAPKRPPLACLFCRGRKITCGPPSGGKEGGPCNQCQRRAIKCEFPAEGRRRMRKKKIVPLREIFLNLTDVNERSTALSLPLASCRSWATFRDQLVEQGIQPLQYYIQQIPTG